MHRMHRIDFNVFGTSRNPSRLTAHHVLRFRFVVYIRRKELQRDQEEAERAQTAERPRNDRGGSAQLPDAFGKAVEDFPSVPAAAGLCPICLDELDDGEVPGAAVTGRLTKLRCRHGTGQVTKRRRKKAEV